MDPARNGQAWRPKHDGADGRFPVPIWLSQHIRLPTPRRLCGGAMEEEPAVRAHLVHRKPRPQLPGVSVVCLQQQHQKPPPTTSALPGAGWHTAGSGPGCSSPGTSPHPRDFTNECEDLKAVWALKTTDPCGELKSASLRIRTRVYSFQHGCLPYGLAYKLQQGTKRGNVYLSFDFRDADYEDLKLRDEWKDFVLILVATYRYPHNHTQPWPLGLIACPAYDGVRYIRIGRFHGYNDDLGELFKQCDVKDIEIV
ncbi:hypothetical protein PG987_016542 [Apiospora arundinis]